MKKKIILIICIVFTLLLIPIPSRLKDGGTVKYSAVLYTVYDVHRIKAIENPDDGSYDTHYVEGTIINILGIEIFNNVK